MKNNKNRNNFKIIFFLLTSLLLIVAFYGCSVKDLKSEEDDKTPINNAQGGSNTPEQILSGYDYAVINQPIRDFNLQDLDGNWVRLSDLKGKIVFLNFWATWCPPCRDEMPHMQTFYEKYKDQDVVILAISPTAVENRGSADSEKAEGQVRKFIKEYKFTFPVLLDRDDKVWAEYQQRGIPANYIIDKEGIIRYLKPGAFRSLDEMEAFADAIRAIEP